jgi:hypothetical protein
MARRSSGIAAANDVIKTLTQRIGWGLATRATSKYRIKRLPRRVTYILITNLALINTLSIN